MPSNTYGRQVVLALTNKSGSGVIAGDVVIIDTSNNEAFTTTTTAGVTGGVGIAQETIASNAVGRVLTSGYAALVNVNASVTRGNYGKTHTVAKQATDMGASRGAGAFVQFLTGGTTPTGRVYSPDLAAAAGNVASDAIWDAAGDLVQGTGADTAAKLSIGTAGQRLAVNSGATAAQWSNLRSTLGTTSVGGSFATRGMYIKKVTIPTGGAFLMSVSAHVKGDSTNSATITGLVYSDSGGNPINIIAASSGVVTRATVLNVQLATINTTARWIAFPIGAWLAAGDYWIGVWFTDGTGSATSLAYSSGTGSDRTVAGGTNNLPQDSSVQAISTGTNDYSIYADILR